MEKTTYYRVVAAEDLGLADGDLGDLECLAKDFAMASAPAWVRSHYPLSARMVENPRFAESDDIVVVAVDCDGLGLDMWRLKDNASARDVWRAQFGVEVESVCDPNPNLAPFENDYELDFFSMCEDGRHVGTRVVANDGREMIFIA